MQEYAESYHKEKLREELILFASQRNEQHFLDWESKYMITVNEINDFKYERMKTILHILFIYLILSCIY